MSAIRRFRVTVEGSVYEVDVEVLDSEPSKIQPTVSASVPTVKKEEASIVSPLAATVVSIDVQVGQAVKQDQCLITLEAMKMNTNVNAPASGLVKAILVGQGDTVEEGQPLIDLE